MVDVRRVSSVVVGVVVVALEEVLDVGARSGHGRKIDLGFAAEALTRNLIQLFPVEQKSDFKTLCTVGKEDGSETKEQLFESLPVFSQPNDA